MASRNPINITKESVWDRVYIPKPRVEKGERDSKVYLVIIDEPRYIVNHELYVKGTKFDVRQGRTVIDHIFKYFRCNAVGDDTFTSEGFCVACEGGNGGHKRERFMIPVVQIQQYTDKKTGELKTSRRKKLYALSKNSKIKYFLENELGVDASKWVGAYIEVTSIPDGHRDGEMLRVLNKTGSGQEQGQAMLDKLMKEDSNLDLSPIPDHEFDGICMKLMDNDSLGKFLTHLHQRKGSDPLSNSNTQNSNAGNQFNQPVNNVDTVNTPEPNGAVHEDDIIPF